MAHNIVTQPELCHASAECDNRAVYELVGRIDCRNEFIPCEPLLVCAKHREWAAGFYGGQSVIERIA